LTSLAATIENRAYSEKWKQCAEFRRTEFGLSARAAAGKPGHRLQDRKARAPDYERDREVKRLTVCYLLLVLAAISSLLVACGGDDDSNDKPTAEATTAGGSTSTTQSATAAPSAASDPNATIRVAFGTDGSRNYDPHLATNQFVITFLLPAYDRLINLTSTGKLEPQLAESWEFSKDAKTLTLKLRKGVVFHDGEPFNAAAVKANLERAMTNPKSKVTADTAVINNVEVVDDLTVRLNLKSPGGSLPALLADRLGMMISPKAFDNPDLDLMPVGAGPYKVVADDPGKVVTYEKFDKYWNPSSQRVAKIEIHIILDPEAALRALRSGQVDAMYVNADQLQTAKDAGLTVQNFPTVGAFIMYLNMSRPAFQNIKVRQAISMAIDREGISKALHNGICTPSQQVFPKGYWANDPGVAADYYKYDPAAAKKLLAESGVKDINFVLAVFSGSFYTRQAEAIQAQLAEIGIKVEVRPTEPAKLLASFTTEKSADAYFSSTGGFVDPAKAVAQLWMPTSTFNPGGFVDQDVVDLAAKGLEATTEEGRAASYKQISKLTVEHVFQIPICNSPTNVATTKKVQGVSANSAGAVNWALVSMAK